MVKLTFDCSFDAAKRLLDWWESNAKGATATADFDVVAGVAPADKTAPKPKGKRGRKPGSANKPKAAPVEAAPEQTIAPVAEPEAKPVQAKPIEQPVPDSGPTIADARTALQALNAKKGMEACMSLLASYKVARVSDLKPVQILDFIMSAGQAAGE